MAGLVPAWQPAAVAVMRPAVAVMRPAVAVMRPAVAVTVTPAVAVTVTPAVAGMQPAAGGSALQLAAERLEVWALMLLSSWAMM